MALIVSSRWSKWLPAYVLVLRWYLRLSELGTRAEIPIGSSADLYTHPAPLHTPSCLMGYLLRHSTYLLRHSTYLLGHSTCLMGYLLGHLLGHPSYMARSTHALHLISLHVTSGYFSSLLDVISSSLLNVIISSLLDVSISLLNVIMSGDSGMDWCPLKWCRLESRTPFEFLVSGMLLDGLWMWVCIGWLYKRIPLSNLS